MEQERAQKKLVNQKVAAVREVVHNKSTNDIILALHNFDLDVERTIQAFCEDGAQSALDTWTTGTGKSNRKKKQKEKKSKTLLTSDSLSSASPCPLSQSETPTSPPGSIANGDISLEYSASGYSLSSSASEALGQLSLTNGMMADPKPQRTSGRLAEATAPGYRWVGGREPDKMNNIPLTNGPEFPEQRKAESAILTRSRPIILTDAANKKKAVDRELKNLSRHDAVEERVQLRFNEETEKAGDRIKRAFDELRTILDDREAYLKDELARCKDEGTRILNERAHQGRQLHVRSERTAAMSDKEIADLRNEIKQFTSDRKYEEELGSTIRFRWDPDQVIALIKNFGEVIPVKPISAQKHSSHSSLVSSLGEDSGLGMTSPVSPPEDKKTVAEVEGGGIVMKSESLTAEQLEDLNRRLQESLQLQGITADILSGVGGTSSMPIRRRQRGGGRGRGGASSRGSRGRGAAGGTRQIPSLSIFEEN